MHRACIHKKKEVIRGKLYVQVRGRMEGNGGNVGDVTSADSYVHCQSACDCRGDGNSGSHNDMGIFYMRNYVLISHVFINR